LAATRISAIVGALVMQYVGHRHSVGRISRFHDDRPEAPLNHAAAGDNGTIRQSIRRGEINFKSFARTLAVDGRLPLFRPHPAPPPVLPMPPVKAGVFTPLSV